jgi:flagellar motility protein MotE (MotC chaperone)
MQARTPAESPPAKSGRRRRPSVAAVVAALLVLSVVARLASGSGAAIAEGLGALTRAEAAISDVAADPGAEPAVCTPPPELADILDSLTQREARVTELEAKLADRERLVALAEEEVRAGLTALETAEARLAATIATAQVAAENDLAKLTSVYENMKPAEAAILFGQMDPVFAAGFLGRMRSDAAAAILAGLPPDLAYSISVVLAGRNASVPTE